MRCPYCHSIEDKVVDSRLANGDTVIRRRRECLSCNQRFTTYEKIEEINIRVIKRNGDKEQYDREKIISGLKKAFEKREITLSDIEKIVDEIEEELKEMPGAEIKSEEIGKIILGKLRQIDEVAYLRFASVYKGFEEASEFSREVELLEKMSPPKTRDKGQKK